MNMEEKILQIPIEDIIPNRFQPRLTFDDQALEELASSIKQHGIIQPLVLRKLGDKYEIIAGERRYKASQLAGLTHVPAVISNIDDDKSAEVALIENIQRKNLTAIEEAKSYKNLLDRGYLTQEQLAEKLGVSQSTIANKLRLLNLADEVQDALLNEKISERHARALLTLKDKNEQVKWLNKILSDRLTVRQLDIELKKLQNNNNDDDASIPLVTLTPNIEEIKENALDINPTQGLHDIESMLKPSMPGEKTFDLNNPIDNIETLDIEETSLEEPQKPQNKFFNFLEDEVANMNEEASIDDIFNKQPIIDSNTNNINSDNIQNINSENLNDMIDLNNNELLSSISENNVNNINEIENNNSDIENNDSLNNNFFNFGNSLNNISNLNNEIENDIVNSTDNSIIENDIVNSTDNSIIENDIVNSNINSIDNNIIEPIVNVKEDNIFDPMSMVNTLEPDYQEKVEEAQGIDLKTAINTIRDMKENLENRGFKISIDEADLGESYTITINIIK